MVGKPRNQWNPWCWNPRAVALWVFLKGQRHQKWQGDWHPKKKNHSFAPGRSHQYSFSVSVLPVTTLPFLNLVVSWITKWASCLTLYNRLKGLSSPKFYDPCCEVLITASTFSTLASSHSVTQEEKGRFLRGKEVPRFFLNYPLCFFSFTDACRARLPNEVLHRSTWVKEK